jgi:hypothetical protein
MTSNKNGLLFLFPKKDGELWGTLIIYTSPICSLKVKANASWRKWLSYP